MIKNYDIEIFEDDMYCNLDRFKIPKEGFENIVIGVADNEYDSFQDALNEIFRYPDMEAYSETIIPLYTIRNKKRTDKVKDGNQIFVVINWNQE